MFAQTAQDCALLLNAMAGHDARDSTSLDATVRGLHPGPRAAARRGCASACPESTFAGGTEVDVIAAIDAALAELRNLGATTVEISLPNVDLSVPVYYVIAPAEASSNLSRFDGVRYGHRAAEYDDLLDMYKKTRAEGFGAEVKRRILVGTYVLSHGYYDAYYLKAQQVRRLIADDFQRAYEKCDVIIGPTSPTTAFKLGDKTDDPVKMYLNDIFTIAGNLTGAPAMSIPCGFDGAWPARRHADSGQLFPRSADAERRAPVSAGDRLASRAFPRHSGHDAENEVGSRHRTGDAHAAVDGVEDLLRRVDRVRRRAEHAGIGRRHRAARACCRC